jgi:hypothetical protein
MLKNAHFLRLNLNSQSSNPARQSNQQKNPILLQEF